MSRRHALYFAPARAHALWAAGCDWLGRDPERASTSRQAVHCDAPRRYGFHATLKPPFALRDGVDEAGLRESLMAFVAARAGFEMPALVVAPLGDFIALRPAEPGATAPGRPLRDLADDCVRHFDAFRRPPSPAELARRVTPDLDAARRANVERWGYPHVFDHWRFHMTLSDSLHASTEGRQARAGLLDDATRHFAAALALPLRCDGVALFTEDAPGADFRLAQRFEFAR